MMTAHEEAPARVATAVVHAMVSPTPEEENMWWRVWQVTAHLKDLAHELTVAGYCATAARAGDQALFWEEFANQGLPF